MDLGKKGAYIARLNLCESHHLGVAKKIRCQVEALKKACGDVDLYFLGNSEIIKNDIKVKTYSQNKFLKRLVYFFLFYYYLANCKLNVEFLYVRYQKCSLSFLYMLHKIKKYNKKVKILVEIPTYPYEVECVSLRDKFFMLIDKVTRPFMKRYVEHIVTFSCEDYIFGIPTVKTNNGVNVDPDLKFSDLSTSEGFHLLGLANLSFWHGFDRIISGLDQYYKMGGQKKVIFNIVGAGRELSRLKNDVLKYGLTDVVVFHGPLYGNELQKIILKCHVGISCIGMHRWHADTTVLKSREYCACGLPFLMGYDDPDFPDSFPYVLRVSQDDCPVNIQSVLEFYDKVVQNSLEYRYDMIRYAEQNLVWTAKMRPVLEAISF